MGRYVSLQIDPTVYYGVRSVKPGYGTGAFRFYGSSSTFTIPSGVTEVRVTALGAGGSGGQAWCACCQCCAWGGAGGGGGGFVVATVPVTAGCVCNIGVGSYPGGSSCFGTAVYAYGGCCSCYANCCSCSYNCVPGGLGGSFCVVSGTCIAGYCGNQGCCNCGGGGSCCRCWGYSYAHGGASGSPMGGNSLGPWPGGTSDYYGCKGFNGEDITSSELSTKFGNTIRWPGEVVLGTSRKDTNISGTAPGYPQLCYCVDMFGGAYPAYCNTASTTWYSNVSTDKRVTGGCGGGGSGSYYTWFQYCNYGYGAWACLCSGCCSCGYIPGSSGGSGFVVVEY